MFFFQPCNIEGNCHGKSGITSVTIQKPQPVTRTRTRGAEEVPVGVQHVKEHKPHVHYSSKFDETHIMFNLLIKIDSCAHRHQLLQIQTDSSCNTAL